VCTVHKLLYNICLHRLVCRTQPIRVEFGIKCLIIYNLLYLCINYIVMLLLFKGTPTLKKSKGCRRNLLKICIPPYLTLLFHSLCFLQYFFYSIRENGQLEVLSAHHQSGGVLQRILFSVH